MIRAADRCPRWANPLTEEEPLLRTTLLPGLMRVLARNIGRGFADVALYEMGLVFRPRPGSPGTPRSCGWTGGPTAAEVASLEEGLPAQPLRLGVVLAGKRELAGWWGDGRPAEWQDAIEAVREVLRAKPGAVTGWSADPACALAPGPVRGHLHHR
jgi:phenylalanyl-tRNA synthetase beta chain